MRKHVTEHMTFVSTEQTGSFWTAELYDTWLSDCSASGFLSTWQVKTKDFLILFGFSLLEHVFLV